MAPRTPRAALAVARGLVKRPPDPENVGMCLRETRELYNVDSRYKTAALAYAATKHRGTGPAPAGALHWWLGGSSGAGHVGLGSSPSALFSIDNVRVGGLDLVTLARIRKTWHALHYVGWSRDLNGATVVPEIRLRTLRADPAAVRIVAHALVDEHLLAEQLADLGTWDKRMTAAYAEWQEKAGFGPATPGVKGPSDGDPGPGSLIRLGLRRGFTVA